MPYSGRRSRLSELVRRYPIRPVPVWRALLVGFGFALLALALRDLLQPLIAGSFRLLTYFPAILFAALTGGWVAGCTTLALGLVMIGGGWIQPGDAALDFPGQGWATLAVVAAFGGLLVVVAVAMRDLVAELTRAQERAMMLAFEMKHRVGNTIGVANSISRQTLREASSLEEYQTLFEARMTALGHAQRVFSEDPDKPADLRALIEATIAPLGAGRFELVGPAVGIPHDFAGSMALLIHELGTNAHKYGALSVPEGRVAIDWKRDGGVVHLTWREIGGPAVTPPARTGFGSRLLRTAFPPHYGAATIDYAPQGVQCRISFPAFVAARDRRWSELFRLGSLR